METGITDNICLSAFHIKGIKMNNNRLLIKFSMIGLLSLLLISCAATQTLIAKRHLNVQTKTSSSIFLTPVANREKSIYVQIKNTSGKENFYIRQRIVTQLRQKGYRVTNNIHSAHYLLQANILRIGVLKQSAADRALHQGYGSIIAGAAGGAAIGALASDRSGAPLVGALVGGIASTIADSAVHDVTYAAISDVQVSERDLNPVKTEKIMHAKQGSSGEIIQRQQLKSQWIHYRTRVVSSAERVNLSFATAKPKLEAGLSHAIAGIF
ncbi:MAG: complement resistance protein TraT [Pseudomonadota bacterium]